MITADGGRATVIPDSHCPDCDSHTEWTRHDWGLFVDCHACGHRATHITEPLDDVDEPNRHDQETPR
ncbi:hypothetical protein GCM10009773_18250 [Williamsia serinedens]